MNAHYRALWRTFEQQSKPFLEHPTFSGTVRDFGKGRVEVMVRYHDWDRENKTWLNLRDMGAVSSYPKEKVEETEADLALKAQRSKDRAVRRAKQRVRWIVAALEADHLLTLTYRENVQDVERVKVDWAKFVRKVTAKKPEWPYVAIREKQSRGAYHLHVAVKGRQDVALLRKCWLEVVGADGGNIDVQGPKRRWGSQGAQWSSRRLTNYMCKYLSKELEGQDEAEKKKYWARKGVEIPQRRVWLGATSFVGAIEEAYRLVRALGSATTNMWVDEEFGVVWISGTG